MRFRRSLSDCHLQLYFIFCPFLIAPRLLIAPSHRLAAITFSFSFKSFNQKPVRYHSRRNRSLASFHFRHNCLRFLTDGVSLADRQKCVSRQRRDSEEMRVDSLQGGFLHLETNACLNKCPIKAELPLIIRLNMVRSRMARIIISNVVAVVVATEIVRSSTFSAHLRRKFTQIKTNRRDPDPGRRRRRRRFWALECRVARNGVSGYRKSIQSFKAWLKYYEGWSWGMWMY